MVKPKNHPLEIDAETVQTLLREDAVIIDIRAPAEQSTGWIPGASTDLSALGEHQTENPVILVCATGRRSLEQARTLRKNGRSDIHSLAGGMAAWRLAGYGISAPQELDQQDVERYARQLILGDFGAAAQAKLKKARATLVGAGGLGSPAALYLAAAGVGQIHVIDDDRVERSNLQRQVLHADQNVGSPKAESAVLRLMELNPSISAEATVVRVGRANADQLLAGSDVVIDGSDNPDTRSVVNAVCVQRALPLVYGAATAFEGQFSLLDPARGGPCYECLFPRDPEQALPDCNTAGVLGVVPGVIGLLQATEAIKVVTGVGDLMLGRLLLFDALALEFRTLRVNRRNDCTICGS